ncbi:LuxR family transcriptional regulator [Asticcacaulis sp. YBE204]|uniref:LuxR family transcriptional regulator n=1 Tax=Asticcacaulis sp. YBE204 TaxID=1282363 RepID=UPI0003C40A35|nr:LuxR family transcriptional regulator [Asticcacaulis sp. YBE204]ESQ80499.1 hypothetical protein AEYBE204_04320 [Asticcacaulis sp. YBE204]
MLFSASGYMFEDFVQDTSEITSREKLYEVFREAMGELGYDRVNFSIGRDQDIPASDMGFGLLSNYPVDWQNYYTEKNFVKIDPVFRCAVSQYGPFRWSDLERKLRLSDKQIRFLRMGEEAGLNNGIGIPFNGPRLQIAGVGLATSAKQIKPYAKLDLISAYCNQFYTVYKRIVAKSHGLTPEMAVLSSREREILTWVAHGKTDDDIGCILGISSNTVDYHIRNIYGKLGVNNRVVAAIKGISNGFIEL